LKLVGYALAGRKPGMRIGPKAAEAGNAGDETIDRPGLCLIRRAAGKLRLEIGQCLRKHGIIGISADRRRRCRFECRKGVFKSFDTLVEGRELGAGSSSRLRAARRSRAERGKGLLLPLEIGFRLAHATLKVLQPFGGVMSDGSCIIDFGAGCGTRSPHSINCRAKPGDLAAECMRRS